MDFSRYISTRGEVQSVDFPSAVMMGLAEDGGLLLPEKLPDYSGQLAAWRCLSYVDLAYAVMQPFIGEAMPTGDLRALLQRSYATFADSAVVPVVPLADNMFLAELFHGPTLAFKDIALQFLGNLFEYILPRQGGRLNILGATSGDTGSAAIHAIRGKAGLDIFIMYPEGRVSPLQERQMATVAAANVHCLALRGTFDDCQRVLKEVFNDLPFKRRFSLAAVNSVNWARILAQVVYYYWAAFRVQDRLGYSGKVQFAVPTGNFGDIFAGYLALRMGAPISRLILATNQNDILCRFFQTGEYRVGRVSPTLSPSMDIQIASNFERYLYYYLHCDPAAVRAAMQTFAITGRLRLSPPSKNDLVAGRANTAETLACIRRYYHSCQYVLDPRTAVAVQVAESFKLDSTPTICLGTAHPGKFPAAISQALGLDHKVTHPTLSSLEALPLRKTILDSNQEAVEDYISRTLSFEPSRPTQIIKE